VLGFRVSGWSRHDGGFVNNHALLEGGLEQNDVNKADSYSARAALLFKPSSFVTAEASFYYQKRDQNSADLFDPTAGDPANGNFVSTRDLIQPINDSFYTPSLKLVFDLGWSQLTSVTSNLHRGDSQGYDYTTVLPPAFGFPLPTSLAEAEPTIVGTTQNNFTQELRLQSPNGTDHFRWTAGLYYSSLHQHDFETVAAPGFAQEVLQNTGETIKQYLGENLVGNVYSYISDQYFGDKEKAVFANGEYDIGSHFTIFGGLRYEQQDSTYLTVSNGPLVGGPAVAASTASSNVVAPKAGVNWKLDDQTLVYFSAAKGYRPGGVQIFRLHLTTARVCRAAGGARQHGQLTSRTTSGAMSSVSKSLLLDRRLSIEGSVYHIDWDRHHQCHPRAGLRDPRWHRTWATPKATASTCR
jgi:iron complex outermembrane receptor protein